MSATEIPKEEFWTKLSSPADSRTIVYSFLHPLVLDGIESSAEKESRADKLRNSVGQLQGLKFYCRIGLCSFLGVVEELDMIRVDILYDESNKDAKEHCLAFGVVGLGKVMEVVSKLELGANEAARKDRNARLFKYEHETERVEILERLPRNAV